MAGARSTRLDGRCCSSTNGRVGARLGARGSSRRHAIAGSRWSSSTRATSLATLVDQAVADGADALGMAGGDGSLAVVAAAAAAHGLPFICVPAGTRNHFALDLGVDRHDVAGALDAFSDGFERRIDLAEVNGRAFLNNVSLGIYGEAVETVGLSRRQGPHPGGDGGAGAWSQWHDASAAPRRRCRA